MISRFKCLKKNRGLGWASSRSESCLHCQDKRFTIHVIIDGGLSLSVSRGGGVSTILESFEEAITLFLCKNKIKMYSINVDSRSFKINDPIHTIQAQLSF